MTVNLLFLTLRALDPVNCHTVIHHPAAYAMEGRRLGAQEFPSSCGVPAGRTHRRANNSTQQPPHGSHTRGNACTLAQALQPKQ